MSMDPEVKDTADRVELHELACRYGDIIDARAWADLDQIFSDDCVYDVSDIKLGVVHGVEALRTYMDREDIHPAAHLITNVYVERIDGDTGLMRSRLLAVQGDGSVAAGAYVDDLVRTPAGWRISRRVFTYTRRRKTP